MLSELKRRFDDVFIDSFLEEVAKGDIPIKQLERMREDVEKDFGDLLAMDDMLA